jgi:DNA-binding transcriptional regulator GbsR (MarR family)
MSTLTPVEHSFVEQNGLFFERSGLPRMAGRILGWLFISEPPLQSLTEIARALGASKASISTNTRLLVGTGLIERTSKPGSRGAYFQITAEGWTSLLEAKLRAITHFKDLAAHGLVELGAQYSEARLERLREVHDFYAFFENEFPGLMDRWRASRNPQE